MGPVSRVPEEEQSLTHTIPIVPSGQELSVSENKTGSDRVPVETSWNEPDGSSDPTMMGCKSRKKKGYIRKKRMYSRMCREVRERNQRDCVCEGD